MTTRNGKTWDEQLRELPAGARPAAAAARNAKLRVAQATAQRDEQSAILRRHIRTLHHKYDLTPNRIANLLGYSRTRVKDLLVPKRDSGVRG